MAVSKNTYRPNTDTNRLFETFFRNSQISDKRKKEWNDVVRHTGGGTLPLRFPVYEYLYQLNVSAQEMVELLQGVASRFAINQNASLYHQSLIQYVRADVSRDLLESITSVELTDSWLFEMLRRAEEEKLSDPDHVYSEVRRREAERIREGLLPLIDFLGPGPEAQRSTAKSSTKLTRSG